MVKRLVLRLIHTLATAFFTLFEVAGIPRVRDDHGAGRNGGGGQ
jgi:hypothetical protein